jgi:Zn-dependent M32 family carboxypeptidase
MRGQLIDAPGYMMNYAVGAILSAAIRARTREIHRATSAGDSTWYGWIAPRLFRYGLEPPSREVIEEFLDRPVSPEALLQDMRRMTTGRSSSRTQ